MLHPSPLQTDAPSSTDSLPDDVVLRVRNVSKKFCRRLKWSMVYGIKDLACNVVGVRQDTSQLRRHEFWALEDVSFDLKRGEILGLIGNNGCGKTTLLRILSGIFPPDNGQIALRGRSTSLIALGAGMHPHLSGRENIYLTGTILGMNTREIREKLDAIVDFSELDDFIDAPVATYSSGMRVRLGFSVAIHLDPQLLFIDEVLAVGDQAFKRKAEARIKALIASGISVVFVSHNLPQIVRLCGEVIHLQHGIIKNQGNPNDVVAAYMLESKPELSTLDLADPQVIASKARTLNREVLSVERIAIGTRKAPTSRTLTTFDDLIVKVDLQIHKRIARFGGRLVVCSDSGVEVFQARIQPEQRRPLAPGTHQVEIVIPRCPLNHNIYFLGISLGDSDGVLYSDDLLADITVESPNDDVVDLHNMSLVKVDSHWNIL